MALVRCRDCREERQVGCLPAGGCAWLVLGPMALAGVAAWQAAKRGGEYGTVWALVLPVPAFILTLLLTVLLLNGGALTIDWILSRGGKCPSCGGRRWSWPFVRDGASDRDGSD